MATGIFDTSRKQGLNFRRRRSPAAGDRQIDRFADLLAEHIDQADIDAGRGDRLDPGGDARKAARELGMAGQSGNGMLQRLRRDLGWQAK